MSDPREAADRAATFKPGDRVRDRATGLRATVDQVLASPFVTVVTVIWDGEQHPRAAYKDAFEPTSTPEEVQGGGLAEAVGKLSSYHNERAHYLRRSSKKSERERSSFHADACSTLRQAAFALRAAGQPEPSSMAGPVGPAKDSEPILTWHANEGWSVLAKDGARFRLVPSSVPAERKSGEGLADRLEHAADAESGSSGVLRQLCREAAAALRAAPAPGPEVSDDMVERACRVWVDLDAGQPNVWPLLDQEERQVRRNIMRTALTAALASTSAQDREGDGS